MPKEIECGACDGTGKDYEFESLEALMDHISSQPNDWKPGWYYNNDGDQIEVFWDNVASTAEWVEGSCGITLHRGCKSGKIIGVTVQGLIARLASNAFAKSRVTPDDKRSK